MLRRRIGLSPTWNAEICYFLIAGLLTSPSIRADVDAKNETGNRTAPWRSWKEVKPEINQAFDACRKIINDASINVPPGSILIGHQGSGSVGPLTSTLELKVNRRPADGSLEKVIILDLHVERDYSPELGQGSSFRITAKIARDEGQKIFKDIINHFEKNKWPYEIVDPKKKENSPEGDKGKVAPEKDPRS